MEGTATNVMLAGSAEVVATADGQADPEPAGRPLRIATTTRVWRSALMVLGGAVALAVAWTNPDRAIGPRWYVWAALATFLGVISGSSFGSGVARRADVNALTPVSFWRVIPSVTFFMIIAVTAVPLSTVFIGQGVSWRGAAFAGIAIIGAAPAGGALAAVRVAALRGLRGPVGQQLAGLMALRRLINRLLTILGSLVVLVTLVNAAGLNWGETKIPVGAVIFAGAASAVLVGLVYIPTASLLRRRCVVFVDDNFSLADVDRAGLVAAAEERGKLEDLLGVNRTTLGELQAGLLIISPLLASAGISLLPTI